MAPNVKQLHLLASSLADIDVVQAKYLPLTHSAEQAVQEQQTAPSRTPAQIAESDSYWGWTADVPSTPVVQEEEQPAKDLFSAASIEANLIKDSQRTTSADIIVASDAAENDDYWAEASTVSASKTKPQHDDYWYAPANPEEALIQAILNDEFARQSVSVQTIQKNLLAARSQSRATGQKAANDGYWAEATVPVDTLKEAYSQSYWNWDSDLRSKAEANKADVIDSIMAEEQCRQAVSCARIEQHLKSTVLPPCGQTKASSDAMWSWSHDAKPSDSYWDTSLPQAVGHQAGYWDM